MLPIFLTLRDPEDQLLAERLYLTYKNRMYNVAYAILRNREDAEDAVMDAVYKTVKNIDRFREADRHRAESLIVIIVRNAAINRYRYNGRRSCASIDELCDPLPDDTPTAPELVVAEDDYNALLSRIGELKPIYRDVLLLKYLYEYPNDAIAAMLGVSETTVRVRLMRAAKALKNLLKGETANEK